MTEDRVPVRCTRCRSIFRERANRLEDGFSRQCPTCETVLSFNDHSSDQNIKRAMRDARELRRKLRDAENERYNASTRSGLPRNFSGREDDR
jgi:predicted  nucleic acid-binding Zn-ribbon protein